MFAFLQPMWAEEGSRHIELSERRRRKGRKRSSKAPASYPQRVQPQLLSRQPTTEKTNSKANLTPAPFSESDDNSSSNYEPDIEVKINFDSNNNNIF